MVFNVHLQKHGDGNEGPPNAAKALGITQVPLLVENEFQILTVAKTPTEEKVSKLKKKKIAIIEDATHVIPETVRHSKLIGK